MSIIMLTQFWVVRGRHFGVLQWARLASTEPATVVCLIHFHLRPLHIHTTQIGMTLACPFDPTACSQWMPAWLFFSWIVLLSYLYLTRFKFMLVYIYMYMYICVCTYLYRFQLHLVIWISLMDMMNSVRNATLDC